LLPLLVLLAAQPADEIEAAEETVRTATTWPAMHWYAILPQDRLEAEIAQRHRDGGPWAALLERVPRGLVGAPYLRSPLGEAAAPDRDPRFRLDAFDCTTFVETAIALGHCDNLPGAERWMELLRYSSAPGSFQTRRHLIESQWLPELIAAGVLEDITEQVGGKATRRVNLALDADRWTKRRIARDLALGAADVPSGRFPIPLIPLEVLAKGAIDIPPGTLINVVRVDLPSSPTLITHQGLALDPPCGGERFVRHASPVAKRVIDEPLSRFIGRYVKPRTERKWKVAGFNLAAIREPASR
jgi:hypothetical protein